MTTKSKQLEQYEIRAIAVAASVDPRTLERAISGHPVRPMVRSRIREQLALRGLLHLLEVAK